MDLVLLRTLYRADGIFSELRTLSGTFVCYTLEHAYQDDDGEYSPKLPDGDYKCIHGIHKLSHGPTFETFEITKVPGHWGVLFHVGNFNKDSDGCVLVGTAITKVGGQSALGQSRVAFKNFMGLQAGVEEFILTVKST